MPQGGLLKPALWPIAKQFLVKLQEALHRASCSSLTFSSAFSPHPLAPLSHSGPCDLSRPAWCYLCRGADVAGDLGEDVNAILLLVDHALHPANLTLDAPSIGTSSAHEKRGSRIPLPPRTSPPMSVRSAALSQDTHRSVGNGMACMLV